MPRVGVEPTWDCSRQILSLVRIPISPPRRANMNDKTIGDGSSTEALVICGSGNICGTFLFQTGLNYNY